jgi:hypothetical protein
MAEMRVAIDSASQPLYTLPAQPTGNFYTFNLPDVPGVVATNNFVSLFNPAASGKTIVIYRATIVPWASAGATTDVSMKVYRTASTPSGGSVVAAANIPKFDSAAPSSIADLRTTNPTVTLGVGPIFSSPPAVTSAGAGAQASFVSEIPAGASFVLHAGEGVVAQTSSGNVNELWNFSVTWLEF